MMGECCSIDGMRHIGAPLRTVAVFPAYACHAKNKVRTSPEGIAAHLGIVRMWAGPVACEDLQPLRSVKSEERLHFQRPPKQSAISATPRQSR